MEADANGLPLKYISVNPLSAKKGMRYGCVICGSDSIFVCTQCKTYYCSREHLSQDDQACHSLICERVEQINEILEMPLAARTRPEVSGRLILLQDECRRVCYLQSRRHVLEENVQLALPAAERSLQYARAVHGNESTELVSPLLALADVATIAGAKDSATQNVASAALLIRTFVQNRVKIIKPVLEQKINTDFKHLEVTSPWFCQEFTQQDEERNSYFLRSSLSSRLSTGQRGSVVSRAGSNGNRRARGVMSSLEVAVKVALGNQLADETFRGEGALLAQLQSRLHSSKARIMQAENKIPEALIEASQALYFSSLAYGVNSLQTALKTFMLCDFGGQSKIFSHGQLKSALIQAQNLMKKTLLEYYSPVIIVIEQLIKDKKIASSTCAKAKALLQEYNKAGFMAEEDRLGFRADLKEATLMSERCIFNLDEGAAKIECKFLTKLSRFCVEEPVGKVEIEELEEVAGELEHGDVLVHLAKIIF
ncbi:Conserved_hypothetical protein [Hexamita inflata]|uniref:MYND-type domain-containing protein n=1 Tax=Hexamita inflata TaxID=28002 RepID=A0AA86RA00_9EUKA|nr:Conserved hypothetical protein [Hexamita inflata]